jgi:hypothetical protein
MIPLQAAGTGHLLDQDFHDRRLLQAYSPLAYAADSLGLPFTDSSARRRSLQQVPVPASLPIPYHIALLQLGPLISPKRHRHPRYFRWLPYRYLVPTQLFQLLSLEGLSGRSAAELKLSTVHSAATLASVPPQAPAARGVIGDAIAISYSARPGGYGSQQRTAYGYF